MTAPLMDDHVEKVGKGTSKAAASEFRGVLDATLGK